MFHIAMLALYLTAPYYLSCYELGFGSAPVFSLLAAEGLLTVAILSKVGNHFFIPLESRIVRYIFDVACVVGFLVFVLPEWLSFAALSFGGTEYMLHCLSDGFLAVFEHDYQLFGVSPFYVATVYLVCHDASHREMEGVKKSLLNNRVVTGARAFSFGICLRCFWFWLYHLLPLGYVGLCISVLSGALVFIGLTAMLHSNMEDGSFKTSFLFFCCGLFSWHAGVRIISIERAASLFPFLFGICFGAMGALLALLSLLTKQASVGPSLLTADGVETETRQIKKPYSDVLAAFVLTDRERQISELSLDGLSSKQCAELLGISSSTVRNTLKRIYLKTGSSGLDDFRHQMNAALSDSGKRPVCDGDVPEMSREDIAIRAVEVLVFGFSILPNGLLGIQSGWNVGNEFVLAVGLAALLISVSMGKTHDARLISQIRFAGHRLMPLLVSLLLSAEIILLFFEGASYPSGRNLLLFLAVLSYVLLFPVCIVVRNKGIKNSQYRWGEPICGVCFALLGVAYEEYWRSYSSLSLFSYLIPFLMAWVTLIFSLNRHRITFPHSVFCCVVLLFVFCWFPAWGMVGVIVSAISVLLSSDLLDTKRLLICFATGVLLGDYAIDTVMDALFAYSPAVLNLFSSSISLWTVAAYTFVLLDAAGVSACIAIAYEFFCSHKLSEITDVEPDRWERFSHFLGAKGLSSGDVSLLLLIAKGRSIKEITKELSYSASSIHAAKARAFRKLGISSRLELLGLFSQLDS